MHFGRRWRRSATPAPTVDPVAPPRSSGDEFVECAYTTALGSRADNQDRCAISPRWAVLSDGAGGHAGGALAAQLTVDAVVSCLQSGELAPAPPLLEEAVTRANEAVRAGRRADHMVGNMAATLTVAVATAVDEGESSWLVANVGDSRAWLVTPQTASQITEDDNVAAQLVRSGNLTPQEALTHPGRNWITRAIGAEDELAPRTTPIRLRPGDALVIASDGLDVLSTDDICRLMAERPNPSDAVGALVASALRKGALDNVTAAVVRHVSSSSHASMPAGDPPAPTA